MVVVVMGITGCGKTTVGRRLAESLGWRFVDADDLHPAANIETMRAGHPLTHAQREPWIARLENELRGWVERGEDVVLAYSGLEASHRGRLTVDPSQVRWIWLDAPDEVLARRLAQREAHFMPASLVPSQRASLEPPAGMPRFTNTGALDDVVEAIRLRLGYPRS